MPVNQLTSCCWYARSDIGGEYWNDRHYDSEADANAAAARIRIENNEIIGIPAVKTGCFPEPCWTVTCDGECEVTLDTEGDGTLFHHPSRAEAEASARGYDWIITSNGRVFCEDDAPAGVRPAH